MQYQRYLRILVGFCVLPIFAFGFGLLIGAVVSKNGRLGLEGVGVLSISWLAARVQSGAKSVNGVGTCLIGKIETTDFPVITKWLCFFYFPILPVRSFYVLGQPDLVIEPGEFVTSYNLVPFSGVGLYWPSVGLSLRWTVGFLLIAAAVYFFFL